MVAEPNRRGGGYEEKLLTAVGSENLRDPIGGNAYGKTNRRPPLSTRDPFTWPRDDVTFEGLRMGHTDCFASEAVRTLFEGSGVEWTLTGKTRWYV